MAEIVNAITRYRDAKKEIPPEWIDELTELQAIQRARLLVREQEVRLRTAIPKWFGEAMAVAQHHDQLAAMPRWQWLGHFLFVSWRCPCCKAERAHRKRKMNLTF